MEKMLLKTRRMQNMLDPIDLQLHKLKDLLSDTDEKIPEIVSVKTLLLEHFNKLTNRLSNILTNDDDTKNYIEMEDKLTELINEFSSINMDNNNLNYDKNNIDIIENLRIKFVKTLKNLENLEYYDLKQQIQDCYDYVNEMGEMKEIEDYENIKELGMILLDVIGPLKIYGKNLISQLLKEKLALCICQIGTTFFMLVNLIKDQHLLNLPIYNTKQYLCKRLCWCMNIIIDIFDCPNPSTDDENYNKENHFVYKMDLTLDIISDILNKNHDEQIKLCQELWLAIEDVFSYTMSIAQVCQPDSFKSITGVSQTIITEYENLKQQLLSDKPDPLLNNLFVNTFTDALYRLERKVNISVLYLVLEVFSDPFSILKKLVGMCGNALPADKRQKTDLDKIIEDFDQMIDKIMQLGLYAIACCGDSTKVANIKNYMASLESLETELVPAIVSFYLHPNDKELRSGVKLLTSQWQKEINKLHGTIDLIIDSGAYCQVILDDLQDKITLMSNNLDNRIKINENQVKIVVHRACTLATQITTTINDIGQENIDKSTIMKIRELKTAIYEADAAAKTLLMDNVTEPQQLRVIKRCELLLSTIKQLQPLLTVVMNNYQSSINISNKNVKYYDCQDNVLRNSISNVQSVGQSDDKNITFIKTPYTAKTGKSPVSIQPSNIKIRNTPSVSCLIPYIEKGRTMRTERSILYKTPKSDIKQLKKANNKFKNLSCIRQHLFSRDSFTSKKDIDFAAFTFDLSDTLAHI